MTDAPALSAHPAVQLALGLGLVWLGLRYHADAAVLRGSLAAARRLLEEVEAADGGAALAAVARRGAGRFAAACVRAELAGLAWGVLGGLLVVASWSAWR